MVHPFFRLGFVGGGFVVFYVVIPDWIGDRWICFDAESEVPGLSPGRQLVYFYIVVIPDWIGDL